MALVSTNNSPFQPISIGRVPRDQAYIYWLWYNHVAPQLTCWINESEHDYDSGCCRCRNTEASRCSPEKLSFLLKTPFCRNVSIVLWRMQYVEHTVSTCIIVTYMALGNVVFFSWSPHLNRSNALKNCIASL